MATYYVRPDGSNTNTGLGTTTGLAWATVIHALSGSGTASVVTGGDTIYIAPGRYAGLTVSPAPSTTINVIGDPACTQFGSSLTPGPVYITNLGDRTGLISANAALMLTNKNNYSFQSLVIGGISCNNALNITLDKCYIYGYNFSSGSSAAFFYNAGTNANLLVKNCVFNFFANRVIEISAASHTSDYVCNIRFENSYINGYSTFVMNNSSGLLFTNCYMTSIGVTGTAVSSSRVQNSIMYGGTISGSAVKNLVEDYNILVLHNRSNVDVGSNSASASQLLNIGDYMTINNVMTMPRESPPATVFNQLIGYGTTSNAPINDYYGKPYGSPMTVGPVVSQTLTGTSFYYPTERNASVITTAPGSTNQTVELYLGATGLTATTTGLRATYARTRSATVSVPLVSQTTTGAWISGGFCEISASTMPGMYRLDVPNAAFADGADNVTIFVGGASGTNGAVQTVNLEYPNTSVLRMGPYKLISNHMGADNPLEVLKGVQAPVDIQLVDNSGGGVDITGATVTAKIYNASSQLIDTYTCTPTYALDGRCSFNLDTTVTDNSGHYTVTVTRQVGGNIVVFGPLRCLVRAN